MIRSHFPQCSLFLLASCCNSVKIKGWVIQVLYSFSQLIFKIELDYSILSDVCRAVWNFVEKLSKCHSVVSDFKWCILSLFLSCAILRSKSISQWLCQGCYFINLMVFLKDIHLVHFSSKWNVFQWFVHLGTGRTLAATGIGVLQELPDWQHFFFLYWLSDSQESFWLNQLTSAFTEGSPQLFCGDCAIKTNKQTCFIFLDC